LLWAALGGAASSVFELQDDLTSYQGLSIDYRHVSKVASGGAILGIAAFVRDLRNRRLIALGMPIEGGTAAATPPAA